MAKSSNNLVKVLVIIVGAMAVLLVTVTVFAFLVYRMFFAHPTQRTNDILSSDAASDSTSEASLKKLAKDFNLEDVEVTQIISYSSPCSAGTKQLVIRGNVEGRGNYSFEFNDTHREYSKLVNIRPGQEIKFEYSDIDGDSKCRALGISSMVKYLRLASVR